MLQLPSPSKEQCCACGVVPHSLPRMGWVRCTLHEVGAVFHATWGGCGAPCHVGWVLCSMPRGVGVVLHATSVLSVHGSGCGSTSSLLNDAQGVGYSNCKMPALP